MLSIELIQKVPEGFQARALYYNLLSTTLTVLLSILAYLTDSFGPSICHTCYLKHNTLGEHSIWIFWAYSPFILLAVYLKSLKKYYISQKLLFTFWIFNVPFAINRAYSIVFGISDVLINIEAFFTSIAGLVIYFVALLFYVSRDRLQVRLLQETPVKQSEEKLSEKKKYKLAVLALLRILESSPKFMFSRIENPEFFSSQKPFELFKDQDSELCSVLPCTVTQYSGEVFSNICAKDNISKSEIIDSLISMKNDPYLIENLSNYGPKFLIKFISTTQLHFFLSTLPNFYQHLVETSRNMSLLNRIIGAYTLKVKKTSHHFLLIENVFTSPTGCEMFELSGSKIVKHIVDNNKGKVFNDLDFLQKYTRLDLKYPERNLLLKVCNDDLQFLKSIGALDYTFFLAIINNCNKIGLTNRFTRHYFDGKDRKVYAIGLVYSFTNIEMVNSSMLRKIGGVDKYAERFTSFLAQITQCGEF